MIILQAVSTTEVMYDHYERLIRRCKTSVDETNRFSVTFRARAFLYRCANPLS